MAQIKYIGKNSDHLYNDGDQVETDILHYTEEHEGDDYRDILKEDDRWPVFYHLTDMRENILGWYDFKEGADILEIGAGMGALTGLLCRKAKSVVSVELTRRRAEVIYNRHKEHDNLTILVGNFNEMKFDRQFDYITLIGVLEYAPGFTPDGEPATFIKKIKTLLKPGGKLLIAIENRFGLKYWCGAAEDHTGKPYDGINGYPETRNIRTFSRAELAGLLNECGLPKQRFYYPLPDYKLPQVLYSDEYLPKNKISAKIRQYCLGKTLHLADEGKLYGDIAQNTVLPFMANSFFVESGAEEETERHPIYALFTPDRKEEYRITTIIHSDDTVEKRAALPQGEAHLQRIFDQQRLYKGKQLVPYTLENGRLEMPMIHADDTLEDILCRLIRNGEIDEARRWMDRFREVILQSSETTGEGNEIILKHGFLDLTFENCFVSGDQFILFDQEWMEDNVPAEYIMFRAIRVLYWQNADLEDIIPFETMVSFYCPDKTKIPAYNQESTKLINEVYETEKNPLNFLDTHKGEIEQTVTTFYFGDEESGFSEENSFKISSILSQEFPCLRISEDLTVPAGCSTVRIDPCEGYPCTVKHIEIISDGKALPYHAVNGFAYPELMVFPTEDPQMMVTLLSRNEQVLHIDFTVSLYSSRDSLLSRIAEREQEKIQEIALKEQELEKINRENTTKEQEIANLQNINVLSQNHINNLNAERQAVEGRLAYFEQEFNRISNSTCWKITKPIRAVLDAVKKPLRKHPRLFVSLLSIKWRLTKGKEETKRLKAEYLANNMAEDPAWYDKDEYKAQQQEKFDKDIRISILVPLYNTPEGFLKQMIASVQEQSYANWELCLADGSDAEHREVRKICRKKAKKDKRIKYQKLKENLGISGNTNACIEMATGDYIALFDHDDMLHPFALYEVMKAICEKGADFVYTDENTFHETPRDAYWAHYKPDYAPDTLRSYNYICHLSVFRKELLNKSGGGFRREYDGSQDYDMILRLTEAAERIVHIPKVLYYWRSHEESVASDVSAKPYTITAAKKALAAHLERVGLKGRVEDSRIPSTYRIQYEIKGNPMISIIIPNKDHVEDLEKCISSIREKSSWQNWEIIIVENNSTEEETFAYYDRISEEDERVRTVRWEKAFNYSSICNFGAEKARGEYLLMLNNDIEVITPEWLEQMLMFAQREDVGAVGAMLYYPDDTIQHAGVILGIGGVAGHSHKYFRRNDYGYASRLTIAQNLSAVTAACLLMRKDVFEQINGFDEGFAVAFNDVDLCMRIREAGYLIVWTPYAELYHYESKSRGYEDTVEKQERFAGEIRRFDSKWSKEVAAGDPYYNPNLTLVREDFSKKEA